MSVPSYVFFQKENFIDNNPFLDLQKQRFKSVVPTVNKHYTFEKIQQHEKQIRVLKSCLYTQKQINAKENAKNKKVENMFAIKKLIKELEYKSKEISESRTI